VGVDGSAAQLAEAVRRGGGVHYARGFATGLPLRDGVADAVVLCLVVEHVEDLDALLDEASRVLRRGGTALVVMNHPLLHTPDSCWVDEWGPGGTAECYWRTGPYLPVAVLDEEVDPGVVVRFWHRPLSVYVNGLASRGLLLTEMVEPAPPADFQVVLSDPAMAATVPRLLLLALEKA
ncbi:MAG: class I SAM-dependent methyltransferase, partial [Actinomycetes bacterium]